VLAAGVAGLLARRVAWLATLWLLLAAFLWHPEWLPIAPGDAPTRDLVVLFALGSLARVWRAAIPVSLPLAAVAIAFVIVDPAGLARGALFAPLLAYVVLVAAYHPRLQWRAFNRVGDYSYGVYVYSFPIQQTLVQRVPGIDPMPLFALALALTLVVAVLSWHAVERPALGLKSRWTPPERTP
jgi:peptidoglycan/LPS O-acetylase OafA/YrhL